MTVFQSLLVVVVVNEVLAVSVLLGLGQGEVCLPDHIGMGVRAIGTVRMHAHAHALLHGLQLLPTPTAAGMIPVQVQLIPILTAVPLIQLLRLPLLPLHVILTLLELHVQLLQLRQRQPALLERFGILREFGFALDDLGQGELGRLALLTDLLRDGREVLIEDFGKAFLAQGFEFFGSGGPVGFVVVGGGGGAGGGYAWWGRLGGGRWWHGWLRFGRCHGRLERMLCYAIWLWIFFALLLDRSIKSIVLEQ